MKKNDRKVRALYCCPKSDKLGGVYKESCQTRKKRAEGVSFAQLLDQFQNIVQYHLIRDLQQPSSVCRPDRSSSTILRITRGRSNHSCGSYQFS